LIKNRSYSCSSNVYEEYSKIEKLGHMGHVSEYTTTEVMEFLKNIGFTVTSVFYRGNYRSNMKRMILRAVPSFSPFVTYVATKFL
jgi:hypothetical protein